MERANVIVASINLAITFILTLVVLVFMRQDSKDDVKEVNAHTDEKLGETTIAVGSEISQSQREMSAQIEVVRTLCQNIYDIVDPNHEIIAPAVDPNV